MFPIPQIQIHQQYALLAFNAEPATLSIEQPAATIQMHTKQAKVHITQQHGELQIDQSRAFDALGVGGVLAMNKRVYDQMFGIAVAAIAKIASDGDRLGDLTNHQNVIGELAWENAFSPLPEIQYVGEASLLNVSEEYIAHTPVIVPELGEVQMEATPNRPIIDGRRGQLNFYLAQRNAIEITAPQIDKQL